MVTELDNQTIFISHSSADNEFARRLCYDLRRALVNDHSVWMDGESLLAGDDWWLTILKEISDRPIFIVIWSPDAALSRWVGDEVTVAWSQKNTSNGKIIIPVVIRKSKLRADLATVQAIDFMPPETYERSFNKLAKVLGIQEIYALETIVPRSTVEPVLDPYLGLQHLVTYPKEIPTHHWSELCVYAYVNNANVGVHNSLDKLSPQEKASLRIYMEPGPSGPPLGSQFTVCPVGAGLAFNPPAITMTWAGDWQKALFKIKPEGHLADTGVNFSVDIFRQNILLKQIKASTYVMQSQAETTSASVPTQIIPYRHSYICYSHDDPDVGPLLESYRNAMAALGDKMFDVTMLRSGQSWDEAMREAIGSADVFQLIWSEYAANSKFVEAQWRFALTLESKRQKGFIRPIYFQKPLYPVPPELSHFHFAYIGIPRM